MSEFELSVDVTYNCPFSCAFCSSPDNNLAQSMNLDIASLCLNFAYKIYNHKDDRITITITGGEPLTLDELPLFILRWSNKLNIINLCTTAALDMGIRYWHDLYYCGLKTVRLSLHSISEENCRAIFGRKYSFSAVNKNIELMMDAGITVHANFLLSKLSASNIDEVWSYCFRKGIRKVRVLGLCKQGRAIDNWDRISLSQQEEALIVKHIDELSTKYGINAEFAGLPNHKWCSHSDENERCLGGTSFFHINTNGDIYACPSVKSVKSEKIGSVYHPKIIVPKQNIFNCLSRRYSNKAVVCSALNGGLNLK